MCHWTTVQLCAQLIGPFTLMEITVTFEETIFYMYINVYDTLFVTFSHQFVPLQGNFLQSFAIFSVCLRESANMLSNVLLTWHAVCLEWSG